MVFVTRSNDDLRGRVEGVQTMLIEIVQNLLQGFDCRQRSGSGCSVFVGQPLGDVQIVFCGCALFCTSLVQAYAYIIKAFEGANAGGANGDALCSVSQEAFNGSAWHGYPFCVHGVTRYFLTLHRFECACTYVERNFVAFYAARIEIFQYFFGEMQTSSGGLPPNL